jgi:hypothetical protein
MSADGLTLTILSSIPEMGKITVHYIETEGKMTKEETERMEREAVRLAGPNINRQIKVKKVLTYIMTDLGGTFIQEEVAEDEWEKLLHS